MSDLLNMEGATTASTKALVTGRPFSKKLKRPLPTYRISRPLGFKLVSTCGALESRNCFFFYIELSVLSFHHAPVGIVLFGVVQHKDHQNEIIPQEPKNVVDKQFFSARFALASLGDDGPCGIQSVLPIDPWCFTSASLHWCIRPRWCMPSSLLWHGALWLGIPLFPPISRWRL